MMLNLWLVVRRDPLPLTPGLWGAFAIMGLLNNVVPFSLIVFGEMRISSGLASILNATTPLFAVPVAHLLTANEKLTPGKALGLLIGFAGVVALVGTDAFVALSGQDSLAEIACLSAALSYAFAGIFGRRFRSVPPIQVATGQLTASTLLLIPLVACVDRPWTLPIPSFTAWLALIGIALLCTVLAYILYFRILATAGATNLLLVTFLIPVSAILLGSLVLGEVLQPGEFAGMLLIGGGLVFIDGRLPGRLWRFQRRAA